MNHIPRILEILPIVMREDRTPVTLPSNQDLKATHLLHRIYLVIRKPDVRILLVQPIPNRTQIRRSKLDQHGRTKIMPKLQIIPVSQTRIARRQRICPTIVRLRDDV